MEIEEIFNPYQDYENLSFSYLDFLKDDIISPALENSNSTISTTDNFPIFNTDPTPQQRWEFNGSPGSGQPKHI